MEQPREVLQAPPREAAAQKAAVQGAWIAARTPAVAQAPCNQAGVDILEAGIPEAAHRRNRVAEAEAAGP